MFPNRMKPSDLFFGQPAANFLNANDDVTDSCLGSSQSFLQSGSSHSLTVNSQELFCDTQNSIDVSEPPNSAYEKYMSLKSSKISHIAKPQTNVTSQTSSVNNKNLEQFIELKNQMSLLQEITSKTASEIASLKEQINAGYHEYSKENMRQAAFEKVSCESFDNISKTLSNLSTVIKENETSIEKFKNDTETNINSLKNMYCDLPRIIGEQINNLSADLAELLQSDGIFMNSLEKSFNDLLSQKLFNLNNEMKKFDQDNQKIWQEMKDRQLKLTNFVSSISKCLEVDFTNRFLELKSIILNLSKPVSKNMNSVFNDLHSSTRDTVCKSSNTFQTAPKDLKPNQSIENIPKKDQYAVNRKPCRFTNNLMSRTPTPILKYLKDSASVNVNAVQESAIVQQNRDAAFESSSSPCLSLDEILCSSKVMLRDSSHIRTDDKLSIQTKPKAIDNSRKPLSLVPKYSVSSNMPYAIPKFSMPSYSSASTSVFSGQQNNCFPPSQVGIRPSWSNCIVPPIMTNLSLPDPKRMAHQPIFSNRRSTDFLIPHTIASHPMYRQLEMSHNNQYALNSSVPVAPLTSTSWNDGVGQIPDNSVLIHSRRQIQISPNVYGKAMPGYIAEYTNTICSPVVNLALPKSSNNMPRRYRRGKKRKYKAMNVSLASSSDY